MIEIRELSKRYGDTAVLQSLDFEVRDGEILCVLGESGCGKTTLLNCFAGLTAYEGAITGVPREVSYVFQKERLLPNLTVQGNLRYVLDGVMGRTRADEEISEILKVVELESCAKKYPSELSGGMAQRVSLARAFAYPSQLLLMDEPFRALDLGLKMRVLSAFLRLKQVRPKTVVLVTHDVEETLLLADRALVLKGAPAEIVREVCIPSPQEVRKLTDSDLQTARTQLYQSLLD